MKRLTLASTSVKDFVSGAVRSGDAEQFAMQLVCPAGLLRLAATYKEGWVKYGKTNYTNGMPIDDILNHSLLHIYKYIQGDRTEDHLSHAAWGLFSAMHFEDLCLHHEGIKSLELKDKDYLNAQIQPRRNRKGNVTRSPRSRRQPK